VVLLASSDEETLISTTDSIKKSIQNAEVHIAKTDLEAIGLIMKHTVNLLIYDVQSSAIDGQKLIDTLRQSAIPVLFITAPVQDESMLAVGFRLNHVDHIAKPFDSEQLHHKIDHYHMLYQKEQRIKDDIEFSRTIMDISSSPIFVTDGHTFLYANKLFLSYFDANNIEELNRTKEVKNLFEEREGYIYTTEENSWLDIYFLNKEDETKAVLLDDADNEIIFNIYDTVESEGYNYAIILEDITSQVEHKRQLNEVILTDINTELPNRIKLIDDLRRNFLNESAIAVIDIKNFRDISNFYGNQIGNQVLRYLANILKDFCEEFDVPVYKVSVDVFAIVDTHSIEAKFEEFIINIVEVVNESIFYIEEYEINVEVVAGISFSNKANKLVTANLALEAAKCQDKFYLVFYEELDKLREYEENLVWIRKLKYAIEHDNIVLYYQPIINNYTGEIEKYECLARMIDGDKIISPYHFLAISKKASLYTKVTKTVVLQAFEKFADLPFKFSINISYEDIVSKGFLTFIKENIDKYNVASKVIFEIAINENIKDYEKLNSFFEEMNALGCQIALDNFGDSNFAKIITLKINYIKIDSRFIKDIDTNRHSYLITKTVVDFAKNLGLKTTAEHVSTKEIADVVNKLGINYSQGYYFSPPLKEPILSLDLLKENLQHKSN
jgi:EAL domain-containing protein (putative c-di-GMP-specific phosphodiesterase class I)/GGDEF domain-containing protein/CheY-like chemotaxis protein